MVQLRTKVIEPRNRLGREHVRKIAYVIGGLGQVGHALGARRQSKKCEKRRQQGRKHGETRAAKASHCFSIVRGQGGGSSRSGRFYTGREMTESTLPTPPTARKHHTETQKHGVLLADDYAWLRDKENPDVTAYLEAENAYAEAVMAPLAGLREELYREMLSHIKQTDVSVSYRDGAWWYYSRTEEGLQYGIYCRKRGGPAGPDADAAEEVVLDGNELAKGHAFFAIGDTDITDDGRWLAYTTDTTGFRQYTLHIKDLATGETLADEVERVGSVVWAADNCTLFYTVEDEQQKRQYQLYRGTAGKLAEAALVFQEDDERFNIAAGTHARRQIHRARVGQPHHQRGAGPGRGRPSRRIPHHCPARGRARVFARPSQRPVVHPHQRSRAQLPAGDRAGRDAGARALDGADCASRRSDARGRGSLRGVLHRLRARGWIAAAATVEVCRRGA